MRDYSYTYAGAETPAVCDITLAVRQGEFLAVTGESGSGKTTLFNALGMNQHFQGGGINAGEVTVYGMPVDESDLFALARAYATVSEDFRTQLLTDIVEGAIAFPLENQGVSVEVMHNGVEHLLELLGIRHLRHRGIDELSGGEGQRVVIAAMLAKLNIFGLDEGNKGLLLLDNFLSDLDPAAQAKLRSILMQLKNAGVSMMITDGTDPEWLLREAADTVLHLQDGMMGYYGPAPQYLETLFSPAAYVAPEFKEPSNSPIALSIHELGFSYGDTPAVHDVTTQIKRGSITGIMGPNGSGKTTLAMMLAGIRPPQNGYIMLMDRPIRDMSRRERVETIGYIPQTTRGSFFTESVREELAFTSQRTGIPQSVTPENVGLAGLEDHHPEDLSTGQKQRLALGCALSTDPQVLILDEPTKGLNPKERQWLARTLEELQARGTTIIVISHDMSMVGQVCTDVILMNEGTIFTKGPSRDIFTDEDLFHNLGWPLPWRKGY